MDSPPPDIWHGNFFDLFKWAVAPFSAMGGWAMVRWAYDRYWLRRDRADTQKLAQTSERDKVIASLDMRSAGYMDRLERSETRLIAEMDALREDARKEVSAIQLERDVVYIVLQELEEEAHVRREAHISTIVRLNALIVLFQRLADGLLGTEGLAEGRAIGPEKEPPRLADIRVRIRNQTLAMKGTA